MAAAQKIDATPVHPAQDSPIEQSQVDASVVDVSSTVHAPDPTASTDVPDRREGPARAAASPPQVAALPPITWWPVDSPRAEPERPTTEHSGAFKAKKPTDAATPSKTWPRQNEFGTRPSRVKKWLPAIIIAPIVTVAAVVLTINGANVPPQQALSDGGSSVSAGASGDAGAAAAQSWIYDNVSASERVITDPSTPVANWRAVDFVVATEEMRTTGVPAISQAIQNSSVVAAFGEGAQRVEIRRVSPEGAVVAAATAARATATRAEYGAEVSRNPGLAVSDIDRVLLSAGRVDSRIALILGSLAAGGEVLVDGFPVIDGEEGSIVRQVALASVGGAPLVEAGQYTAAGTSVIDSLTGAFAPSEVLVDGGNIVLRYSLTVDPLGD
ncbi:hypothetical protein ACFM35_04785 [Microbacterium sp. P01]|uniref:hypothetical protein n=1 Tax=Microbacterium sp. P01 TaxID=3366261 RepID=UPI00366B4C1D